MENAIAAIAGASHQPHRKPHPLFAGDSQCGDRAGQQHRGQVSTHQEMAIALFSVDR